MKSKFMWMLMAAALLAGLLLYRTWPESKLNVTPEAAREIEKAKRR